MYLPNESLKVGYFDGKFNIRGTSTKIRDYMVVNVTGAFPVKMNRWDIKDCAKNIGILMHMKFQHQLRPDAKNAIAQFYEALQSASYCKVSMGWFTGYLSMLNEYHTTVIIDRYTFWYHHDLVFPGLKFCYSSVSYIDAHSKDGEVTIYA